MRVGEGLEQPPMFAWSKAHPLPPLPLDEDYIPCAKCGAPDPVRLGRDMKGQYGCSECLTYDRCEKHDRWTFRENGHRCPQC